MGLILVFPLPILILSLFNTPQAFQFVLRGCRCLKASVTIHFYLYGHFYIVIDQFGQSLRLIALLWQQKGTHIAYKSSDGATNANIVYTFIFITCSFFVVVVYLSLENWEHQNNPSLY